MKDPCNECLLTTNCTEVCWEKENYNTLLKNAIRQHTCGQQSRYRRRIISPRGYFKYSEKFNKSQDGVMQIVRRGLNKSSGE